MWLRALLIYLILSSGIYSPLLKTYVSLWGFGNEIILRVKYQQEIRMESLKFGLIKKLPPV